VTGWSGRAWRRVTAELPEAEALTVRWRYTTDRQYVGRGVYVDRLRVTAGGRALFDESRAADAGRIATVGWAAAAD
jgi:hypothetical protein